MVAPAPPRWVSLIAFLIINSWVLSITSYLIHKILQSRRQTADVNKSTFYPAIVFMFSNWFTTLWATAGPIYGLIQLARFNGDVDMIVDLPASTVIDAGAAFLYLLQNLTLLIALFARLKALFANGPIQLSKCSIVAYIVVFSLMPVLSAGIPISRAMGRGIIWQRILTFSVIFLVEIVLTSMLALFIIKLKQIQKNKTLNAFIRRQMILAVLTMASNLWILIVTLSRFMPFIDDDKMENTAINNWIIFIKTFAFAFHILCNFLCVALSYRCCDSLLVLLCGCLRCCRVIPITTADHDAIFLEQIMRNSKGDNQQIERGGPSRRTMPTEDNGNANGTPNRTTVIAMTPVYEY